MFDTIVFAKVIIKGTNMGERQLKSFYRLYANIMHSWLYVWAKKTGNQEHVRSGCRK